VIIVADTSPLISLSVINRIDLLEKMYTEFFICEAVWFETEKYLSNQNAFEHLHFFKAHVKGVSDKSLIPVFDKLDRGEAESIALLRELHANALLIDDMIGRAYAERQNIECFGVLRLLIEAKKLNLIVNLRPYFESFLFHRRFYSKHLLNIVLAEVHEPLL